MDVKLKVEAVLVFRASCGCGWSQTEPSEHEAETAAVQHRTNPRCQGCGEQHPHDDVDWFPHEEVILCHDCATWYPEG